MTNKLRPEARLQFRLRDAADAMMLANWGDPKMRKYHLTDARENLCFALMPDAAAPLGQGEEWLIDTIRTAILDSTDIDCTAESQARYIVDALFKHLREASDA